MLITNHITITFISGEDDEAQKGFLRSNDMSQWKVSCGSIGTTYTYMKTILATQKGKTYDVKS